MAKGAESNLPNLVRNTCDGFTDGGQKLYLDLLDRYQGWSDRLGEQRAFFEADRFERLVGKTLSHILGNWPICLEGRDASSDWKRSVGHFFADRWKNNFMEQATHG